MHNFKIFCPSGLKLSDMTTDELQTSSCNGQTEFHPAKLLHNFQQNLFATLFYWGSQQDCPLYYCNNLIGSILI